MKVSAFTLRRAPLPLLVAVAWLAVHVPSLAPSLEDIDSINFALGLRDFDPARHQPHPPGYPVYVALGRLSNAVVGDEARALAIWSAAGGAVAIAAAWSFFRTLGSAPAAFWGAVLLASAPLFWVTGLRPMTDTPGLAAALAALALIARGLEERRWLAWGALVAGLAVGIRSQTVWLTLPLLLFALVVHRGA